jgi:ABC-type uncharacterized transport system substrate-binding protein
MKRREFITLLGGAAAVWPLGVGAQQPTMPVVGLLRSTTAAPFARLVAELRKGLSEEGLIEGRNVAIEQRWADNQPDRLPGLAADLVSRKAAVIVANTPALEATRAASPTVPIVFVVGWRSRQNGSRHQSQSTGGKPYGRDVLRRQCAQCEAAGIVA